MQTEALSVHSLHEPASSILEKSDRELSTGGLPLVATMLFASEGLVLGHIEDRRGVEGQLVHEALFEHRLQVVPPGNLKRCA